MRWLFIFDLFYRMFLPVKTFSCACSKETDCLVLMDFSLNLSNKKTGLKGSCHPIGLLITTCCTKYKYFKPVAFIAMLISNMKSQFCEADKSSLNVTLHLRKVTYAQKHLRQFSSSDSSLQSLSPSQYQCSAMQLPSVQRNSLSEHLRISDEI